MATGMEKNLPLFYSWLESEPWRKWKRIGLTGLRGSSKAYILSHLREKIRGPLLVIVPHLRNAESLLEDLRFFQWEISSPSLLFPQWETLPYDEIPPHPEIIKERLKCLFSLLRGEEVIIVSSMKALIQKVLSPLKLKESVFSLFVGEEMARNHLVHFLHENGYASTRRVEERGDFSLRGAIVDIYTPFYEEPLRLEFEGDRLESIRQFDIETQRSAIQRGMKNAILLPARDILRNSSNQPSATLFDYLKENGVVFVVKTDILMERNTLYGKHHKAFIMSKERSLDIDELIDFKIAKMMLDER